MAVEADHPPNTLFGLFNSRPPRLVNMDSSMAAEARSGTGTGAVAGPCLFPFYQSLEAYDELSRRGAAPATEFLHTPVIACNPAPSAMFPIIQRQAANAPIVQKAASVVAAARPHQHRKRKMSGNDTQMPSLSIQNSADYAALTLIDLNHAQACAASPPARHNNKVSTGLRLASFDEDGSTVTSSRPDTGSACVNDELALRVLHQQNELQQLFKTHAEQLKTALKDQMHKQVQSVRITLEEEISRRLREKDTELAQIKRHCSELGDRIKHLTVDTHVWQSKARSYEGMVMVLRANLQQAMRHRSREQVMLEGFGDSDADDAASAHIDENLSAQQVRATMMMEKKVVLSRACKKCQAKEVTILLLPCMHLCLCGDCKQDVERCPLCETPTSAFVEVYLS